MKKLLVSPKIPELSPEHRRMLDELEESRPISYFKAMYSGILEGWLGRIVYRKATPQIKGPITLGKLRWRGVKLVRVWDHSTSSTIYEVRQREKILGFIKFRFDKDLLNTIVTVTKC